MHTRRALVGASGAVAATLAAAAAVVTPAQAHHSFGAYNAEVTTVVTGVVTRVNPDVNHLQVFYARMNPERTGVLRDENGDMIIWAVEMAGSAQSAAEGISVNSFPRGTVFSVGFNPLRNGDPAGARRGAIVKCPERTPPEAGKHCDSVEGSVVLGGGELATPTEPSES